MDKINVIDKNKDANFINKDIFNERKKKTFDPVELTYIFDGSKALTEKRRKIGNSTE